MLLSPESSFSETSYYRPFHFPVHTNKQKLNIVQVYVLSYTSQDYFSYILAITLQVRCKFHRVH